jgi:hypothetical protein
LATEQPDETEQLAQVDPCKPRHREGIRLDKAMGLSTPVQSVQDEEGGRGDGLHVVTYKLIRLGSLLRGVTKRLLLGWTSEG